METSIKKGTLVASATRKGVTLSAVERETIIEGKPVRKVYPAHTVKLNVNSFTNEITMKPDNIVLYNYIKGGFRFSESRKKDIISEKLLGLKASNGLRMLFEKPFVDASLFADSILTYLMKLSTHV